MSDRLSDAELDAAHERAMYELRKLDGTLVSRESALSEEVLACDLVALIAEIRSHRTRLSKADVEKVTCLAPTRWRPSNVQCIACGKYGQSCERTSRPATTGDVDVDAFRRARQPIRLSKADVEALGKLQSSAWIDEGDCGIGDLTPAEFRAALHAIDRLLDLAGKGKG